MPARLNCIPVAATTVTGNVACPIATGTTAVGPGAAAGPIAGCPNIAGTTVGGGKGAAFAGKGATATKGAAIAFKGTAAAGKGVTAAKAAAAVGATGAAATTTGSGLALSTAGLASIGGGIVAPAILAAAVVLTIGTIGYLKSMEAMSLKRADHLPDDF